MVAAGRSTGPGLTRIVCAMSRASARTGGLLLPLLVLLASLGTGAGLLARQGALLVHQCVSAGGFGRFGLSLALLRVDAACPNGTYGVGDGQRVIGVVVAVALPVLLAHLAAASLGVGLTAHLHRALRALVATLVRVRRPLAEPVALPVVPALPAEAPVRRPRTADVAGGPWRRGPPEVRFA